MKGLKLAVLYGLKPHEMGYCGPRQKRDQILRAFLEGEVSAKEVKEVLQQFKAAYPYYQLIARSNNIKDPFDFKVVYAYWIGSQLLENIAIGDLRQTIAEEFSGFGLLPKDVAQQKASEIPKRSLPHHSFHVLTLGAITGSVDLKTPMMKDLCRVSWGQVETIKVAEKIKVSARYQPLIKKTKKIILGKPVLREFFWDLELLPELRVGDWVSFHWGQAVQVLTPYDVKNLEKYTQRTLNS